MILPKNLIRVLFQPRIGQVKKSDLNQALMLLAVYQVIL